MLKKIKWLKNKLKNSIKFIIFLLFTIFLYFYLLELYYIKIISLNNHYYCKILNDSNGFFKNIVKIFENTIFFLNSRIPIFIYNFELFIKLYFIEKVLLPNLNLIQYIYSIIIPIIFYQVLNTLLIGFLIIIKYFKKYYYYILLLKFKLFYWINHNSLFLLIYIFHFLISIKINVTIADIEKPKLFIKISKIFNMHKFVKYVYFLYKMVNMFINYFLFIFIKNIKYLINFLILIFQFFNFSILFKFYKKYFILQKYQHISILKYITYIKKLFFLFFQIKHIYLNFVKSLYEFNRLFGYIALAIFKSFKSFILLFTLYTFKKIGIPLRLTFRIFSLGYSIILALIYLLLHDCLTFIKLLFKTIRGGYFREIFFRFLSFSVLSLYFINLDKIFVLNYINYSFFTEIFIKILKFKIYFKIEFDYLSQPILYSILTLFLLIELASLYYTAISSKFIFYATLYSIVYLTYLFLYLIPESGFLLNVLYFSGSFLLLLLFSFRALREDFKINLPINPFLCKDADFTAKITKRLAIIYRYRDRIFNVFTDHLIILFYILFFIQITFDLRDTYFFENNNFLSILNLSKIQKILVIAYILVRQSTYAYFIWLTLFSYFLILNLIIIIILAKTNFSYLGLFIQSSLNETTFLSNTGMIQSISGFEYIFFSIKNYKYSWYFGELFVNMIKDFSSINKKDFLFFTNLPFNQYGDMFVNPYLFTASDDHNWVLIESLEKNYFNNIKLERSISESTLGNTEKFWPIERNLYTWFGEFIEYDLYYGWSHSVIIDTQTFYDYSPYGLTNILGDGFMKNLLTDIFTIFVGPVELDESATLNISEWGSNYVAGSTTNRISGGMTSGFENSNNLNLEQKKRENGETFHEWFPGFYILDGKLDTKFSYFYLSFFLIITIPIIVLSVYFTVFGKKSNHFDENFGELEISNYNFYFFGNEQSQTFSTYFWNEIYNTKYEWPTDTMPVDPVAYEPTNNLFEDIFKHCQSGLFNYSILDSYFFVPILKHTEGYTSQSYKDFLMPILFPTNNDSKSSRIEDFNKFYENLKKLKNNTEDFKTKETNYDFKKLNSSWDSKKENINFIHSRNTDTWHEKRFYDVNEQGNLLDLIYIAKKSQLKNKKNIEILGKIGLNSTNLFNKLNKNTIPTHNMRYFDNLKKDKALSFRSKTYSGYVKKFGIFNNNKNIILNNKSLGIKNLVIKLEGLHFKKNYINKTENHSEFGENSYKTDKNKNKLPGDFSTSSGIGLIGYREETSSITEKSPFSITKRGFKLKHQENYHRTIKSMRTSRYWHPKYENTTLNRKKNLPNSNSILNDLDLDLHIINSAGSAILANEIAYEHNFEYSNLFESFIFELISPDGQRHRDLEYEFDSSQPEFSTVSEMADPDGNFNESGLFENDTIIDDPRTEILTNWTASITNMNAVEDLFLGDSINNNHVWSDYLESYANELSISQENINENVGEHSQYQENSNSISVVDQSSFNIFSVDDLSSGLVDSEFDLDNSKNYYGFFKYFLTIKAKLIRSGLRDTLNYKINTIKYYNKKINNLRIKNFISTSVTPSITILNKKILKIKKIIDTFLDLKFENDLFNRKFTNKKIILLKYPLKKADRLLNPEFNKLSIVSLAINKYPINSVVVKNKYLDCQLIIFTKFYKTLKKIKNSFKLKYFLKKTNSTYLNYRIFKILNQKYLIGSNVRIFNQKNSFFIYNFYLTNLVKNSIERSYEVSWYFLSYYKLFLKKSFILNFKNTGLNVIFYKNNLLLKKAYLFFNSVSFKYLKLPKLSWIGKGSLLNCSVLIFIKFRIKKYFLAKFKQLYYNFAYNNNYIKTNLRKFLTTYYLKKKYLFNYLLKKSNLFFNVRKKNSLSLNNIFYLKKININFIKKLYNYKNLYTNMIFLKIQPKNITNSLIYLLKVIYILFFRLKTLYLLQNCKKINYWLDLNLYFTLYLLEILFYFSNINLKQKFIFYKSKFLITYIYKYYYKKKNNLISINKSSKNLKPLLININKLLKSREVVLLILLSIYFSNILYFYLINIKKSIFIYFIVKNIKFLFKFSLSILINLNTFKINLNLIIVNFLTKNLLNKINSLLDYFGYYIPHHNKTIILFENNLKNTFKFSNTKIIDFKNYINFQKLFLYLVKINKIIQIFNNLLIFNKLRFNLNIFYYINNIKLSAINTTLLSISKIVLKPLFVVFKKNINFIDKITPPNKNINFKNTWGGLKMHNNRKKKVKFYNKNQKYYKLKSRALSNNFFKIIKIVVKELLYPKIRNSIKKWYSLQRKIIWLYLFVFRRKPNIENSIRKTLPVKPELIYKDSQTFNKKYSSIWIKELMWGSKKNIYQDSSSFSPSIYLEKLKYSQTASFSEIIDIFPIRLKFRKYLKNRFKAFIYKISKFHLLFKDSDISEVGVRYFFEDVSSIFSKYLITKIMCLNQFKSINYNLIEYFTNTDEKFDLNLDRSLAFISANRWGNYKNSKMFTYIKKNWLSYIATSNSIVSYFCLSSKLSEISKSYIIDYVENFSDFYNDDLKKIEIRSKLSTFLKLSWYGNQKFSNIKIWLLFPKISELRNNWTKSFTKYTVLSKDLIKIKEHISVLIFRNIFNLIFIKNKKNTKYDLSLKKLIYIYKYKNRPENTELWYSTQMWGDSGYKNFNYEFDFNYLTVCENSTFLFISRLFKASIQKLLFVKKAWNFFIHSGNLGKSLIKNIFWVSLDQQIKKNKSIHTNSKNKSSILAISNFLAKKLEKTFLKKNIKHKKYWFKSIFETEDFLKIYKNYYKNIISYDISIYEKDIFFVYKYEYVSHFFLNKLFKLLNLGYLQIFFNYSDIHWQNKNFPYTFIKISDNSEVRWALEVYTNLNKIANFNSLSLNIKKISFLEWRSLFLFNKKNIKIKNYFILFTIITTYIKNHTDYWWQNKKSKIYVSSFVFIFWNMIPNFFTKVRIKKIPHLYFIDNKKNSNLIKLYNYDQTKDYIINILEYVYETTNFKFIKNIMNPINETTIKWKEKKLLILNFRELLLIYTFLPYKRLVSSLFNTLFFMYEKIQPITLEDVAYYKDYSNLFIHKILYLLKLKKINLVHINKKKINFLLKIINFKFLNRIDWFQLNIKNKTKLNLNKVIVDSDSNFFVNISKIRKKIKNKYINKIETVNILKNNYEKIISDSLNYEIEDEHWAEIEKDENWTSSSETSISSVTTFDEDYFWKQRDIKDKAISYLRSLSYELNSTNKWQHFEYESQINMLKSFGYKFPILNKRKSISRLVINNIKNKDVKFGSRSRYFKDTENARYFYFHDINKFSKLIDEDEEDFNKKDPHVYNNIFIINRKYKNKKHNPIRIRRGFYFKKNEKDKLEKKKRHPIYRRWKTERDAYSKRLNLVNNGIGYGRYYGKIKKKKKIAMLKKAKVRNIVYGLNKYNKNNKFIVENRTEKRLVVLNKNEKINKLFYDKGKITIKTDVNSVRIKSEVFAELYRIYRKLTKKTKFYDWQIRNKFKYIAIKKNLTYFLADKKNSKLILYKFPKDTEMSERLKRVDDPLSDANINWFFKVTLNGNFKNFILTDRFARFNYNKYKKKRIKQTQYQKYFGEYFLKDLDYEFDFWKLYYKWSRKYHKGDIFHPESIKEREIHKNFVKKNKLENYKKIKQSEKDNLKFIQVIQDFFYIKNYNKTLKNYNKIKNKHNINKYLTNKTSPNDNFSSNSIKKLSYKYTGLGYTEYYYINKNNYLKSMDLFYKNKKLIYKENLQKLKYWNRNIKKKTNQPHKRIPDFLRIKTKQKMYRNLLVLSSIDKFKKFWLGTKIDKLLYNYKLGGESVKMQQRLLPILMYRPKYAEKYKYILGDTLKNRKIFWWKKDKKILKNKNKYIKNYFRKNRSWFLRKNYIQKAGYKKNRILHLEEPVSVIIDRFRLDFQTDYTINNRIWYWTDNIGTQSDYLVENPTSSGHKAKIYITKLKNQEFSSENVSKEMIYKIFPFFLNGEWSGSESGQTVIGSQSPTISKFDPDYKTFHPIFGIYLLNFNRLKKDITHLGWDFTENLISLNFLKKKIFIFVSDHDTQFFDDKVLQIQNFWLFWLEFFRHLYINRWTLVYNYTNTHTDLTNIRYPVGFLQDIYWFKYLIYSRFIKKIILSNKNITIRDSNLIKIKTKRVGNRLNNLKYLVYLYIIKNLKNDYINIKKNKLKINLLSWDFIKKYKHLNFLIFMLGAVVKNNKATLENFLPEHLNFPNINKFFEYKNFHRTIIFTRSLNQKRAKMTNPVMAYYKPYNNTSIVGLFNQEFFEYDPEIPIKRYTYLWYNYATSGLPNPWKYESESDTNMYKKNGYSDREFLKFRLHNENIENRLIPEFSLNNSFMWDGANSTTLKKKTNKLEILQDSVRKDSNLKLKRNWYFSNHILDSSLVLSAYTGNWLIFSDFEPDRQRTKERNLKHGSKYRLNFNTELWWTKTELPNYNFRRLDGLEYNIDHGVLESDGEIFHLQNGLLNVANLEENLDNCETVLPLFERSLIDPESPALNEDGEFPEFDLNIEYNNEIIKRLSLMRNNNVYYPKHTQIAYIGEPQFTSTSTEWHTELEYESEEWNNFNKNAIENMLDSKKKIKSYKFKTGTIDWSDNNYSRNLKNEILHLEYSAQARKNNYSYSSSIKLFSNFNENYDFNIIDIADIVDILSIKNIHPVSYNIEHIYMDNIENKIDEALEFTTLSGLGYNSLFFNYKKTTMTKKLSWYYVDIISEINKNTLENGQAIDYDLLLYKYAINYWKIILEVDTLWAIGYSWSFPQIVDTSNNIDEFLPIWNYDPSVWEYYGIEYALSPLTLKDDSKVLLNAKIARFDLQLNWLAQKDLTDVGISINNLGWGGSDIVKGLAKHLPYDMLYGSDNDSDFEMYTELFFFKNLQENLTGFHSSSSDISITSNTDSDEYPQNGWSAEKFHNLASNIYLDRDNLHENIFFSKLKKSNDNYDSYEETNMDKEDFKNIFVATENDNVLKHRTSERDDEIIGRAEHLDDNSIGEGGVIEEQLGTKYYLSSSRNKYHEEDPTIDPDLNENDYMSDINLINYDIDDSRDIDYVSFSSIDNSKSRLIADSVWKTIYFDFLSKYNYQINDVKLYEKKSNKSLEPYFIDKYYNFETMYLSHEDSFNSIASTHADYNNFLNQKRIDIFIKLQNKLTRLSLNFIKKNNFANKTIKVYNPKYIILTKDLKRFYTENLTNCIKKSAYNVLIKNKINIQYSKLILDKNNRNYSIHNKYELNKYKKYNNIFLFKNIKNNIYNIVDTAESLLMGVIVDVRDNSKSIDKDFPATKLIYLNHRNLVYRKHRFSWDIPLKTKPPNIAIIKSKKKIKISKLEWIYEEEQSYWFLPYEILFEAVYEVYNKIFKGISRINIFKFNRQRSIDYKKYYIKSIPKYVYFWLCFFISIKKKNHYNRNIYANIGKILTKTGIFRNFRKNLLYRNRSNIWNNLLPYSNQWNIQNKFSNNFGKFTYLKNKKYQYNKHLVEMGSALYINVGSKDLGSLITIGNSKLNFENNFVKLLDKDTKRFRSVKKFYANEQRQVNYYLSKRKVSLQFNKNKDALHYKTLGNYNYGVSNMQLASKRGGVGDSSHWSSGTEYLGEQFSRIFRPHADLFGIDDNARRNNRYTYSPEMETEHTDNRFEYESDGEFFNEVNDVDNFYRRTTEYSEIYKNLMSEKDDPIDHFYDNNSVPGVAYEQFSYIDWGFDTDQDQLNSDKNFLKSEKYTGDLQRDRSSESVYLDFIQNEYARELRQNPEEIGDWTVSDFYTEIYFKHEISEIPISTNESELYSIDSSNSISDYILGMGDDSYLGEKTLHLSDENSSDYEDWVFQNNDGGANFDFDLLDKMQNILQFDANIKPITNPNIDIFNFNSNISTNPVFAFEDFNEKAMLDSKFNENLHNSNWGDFNKMELEDNSRETIDFYRQQKYIDSFYLESYLNEILIDLNITKNTGISFNIYQYFIHKKKYTSFKYLLYKNTNYLKHYRAIMLDLGLNKYMF